MKKLSKILSVGLSLVMCASLVAPSFAASFAELQSVIDEEQSLYKKDDEGNDTEEVRIGYEGGTVTLHEKVKYESGNPGTIVINSGKNVTIDLNGNDIDGQNKSSSVITVNKGGELTLKDSTAEWVEDEDGNETYESGKITGGYDANNSGGGVDNAGMFTMESGAVSGNKARYGGGVANGGTFIMEGGVISNNWANNSGGIRNNGAFEMNGGTIEDNTGSGWGGGGVGNYGTFTMTDGAIKDNSCIAGGGVWNVQTLTINGGEISGNKAIGDDGGGIYSNAGTLTINGGEISENTTTRNGGGIRNNATLIINGGEIVNNEANGVYNGIFNLGSATVAEDSANNSIVICNPDKEGTSGNDQNGKETRHDFADGEAVDLGAEGHAYKCAYCEGQKIESHTWGEWEVVTPATCHLEGTQARHCVEGCERTDVLDIDPDNHDGETEVRGAVEPTYDSEGYTGDTYCLSCNELIKKGETIPRLEHPVVPTPPQTVIEDNDVPLGDEPDVPEAADEPVEIEDPETPLGETPEEVIDIEDPEAPLGETPDEVIDIKDPETPLGELPELIDIDESGVPLGDVPQTGEASTAVWLAVLLASGMGLVYLNTGKRKENV